MSPMEWFALGSLIVLLCGNLLGGAVGVVKLIHCLDQRFAKQEEKAAARHLEVSNRLTALETSNSREPPRARRVQHVG